MDYIKFDLQVSNSAVLCFHAWTLRHSPFECQFLLVLFLAVPCLPGMCFNSCVWCKMKQAHCVHRAFFVGHTQCDPAVFHPLVALTWGMVVMSSIPSQNDHSFN